MSDPFRIEVFNDRVQIGEESFPFSFDAVNDLFNVLLPDFDRIANFEEAPEDLEAALELDAARKKVKENIPAFGNRLFDLTFGTKKAKNLFNGSTGPVYICFDEDEMHAIPWETMRQGPQLIALNRGLVRTVKYPVPKSKPAASSEIAFFIASPELDPRIKDQHSPHQPGRFDLGFYEQLCKNEIAEKRKGLKVRFCADGEYEKYLDMISRGPALLHLSMHGNPQELAFETESGEIRSIDMMKWPETIKNRPELQLIVMDSCSTAGSGTDAHNYGMFGSSPCASALQVGAPAVIAMRYPVLMSASRVYMERFYKNIFESGMTLERSHREAARRLHDDPEKEKFTDWGWLTPALYMHDNHVRAEGYNIEFGKSRSKSVFIPEPERPALYAPVEHFRHFVGRRKEMRDILRSFRPGTAGNLFVLHGGGGMGKTQLAVEAAVKMSHRGWFEEVLFASARSAPVESAEISGSLADKSHTVQTADFREFLSELAKKLDINPGVKDTSQKLIEKIHKALSDATKRLLILDNMETHHNHPFLKPLLLGIPRNNKVILTSRNPIEGVAPDVAQITDLHPNEAYGMALNMFSDKGFVPDTALLTRLINATSLIPLYIAVFFVASIGDFKEFLERLQALERLEKEFGKTAEYIFAEAIGSLAPEKKKILSAAAIFFPRFTPRLVALVLGEDENHVRETLEDFAARTRLITLQEPSVSEAGGPQPEYFLRLQDMAKKHLLDSLEKEPGYIDFLHRAAAALSPLLDDNHLQPLLLEAVENTLSNIAGLMHNNRLWEQAEILYRLLLSKIDKNINPFTYYSSAGNLCVLLGDKPVPCAEARAAAMNERLKLLKSTLEFFNEIERPENYATTQNNLGNAFCNLPSASAQDREKNLNAAISCYQEALKIRRPDNYPEAYATTQNNLGNAYKNLPSANAEDRAKNLKTAISCYGEALKICRPDNYPEGYAATQSNLGTAYFRLPSDSAQDREKNLKAAISCYEEALNIRRSDNYPEDYAATQNNLGNVYLRLPSDSAQNRAKNLKAAISCFEEALKIYRPDNYPEGYALTQSNLGNAYYSLPSASAQVREMNLKAAISCFEEALKIYRPDNYPEGYAATQNNLGNAYYSLPSASAQVREMNLKAAISCYEEALKIRKPDNYPEDYAETQSNLGIAYCSLLSEDNKEVESNLLKALNCWNNSLSVYRKDTYPERFSTIKANIGRMWMQMFLLKEEDKESAEKAAEAFGEAMEVWKDNPYYYYPIAEQKFSALLASGKLEKAQELLNDLVKNLKWLPDGGENLIGLLKKMGLIKEENGEEKE